MNPILVIGAGGHCRSVMSVILAENKWQPIGVIDAGVPRENESILGVPVVAGLDSLLSGNTFGAKHIVVAIGDNNDRSSISKKLRHAGFDLPNIFSPRAVVDPSAKFYSGSVVMPGAVICVMAKVGDGCIVNTNAVLEHESSIGDWVHLAPGAVVAGRSHIGQHVFLGANSTVVDKCQIADDVTIGAGSVVITDALEKHETYVGSPARQIEKEDSNG